MKRSILVVLASAALVPLGACGAEGAPAAARPSKAAASASPSTSASTVAEATPTTTKRTVTRTRKIPFRTRKVNDAALAKGATKVRTRGAAGLKTLTYEVTLTNGVETDRKLIRTVVTKRAVTRVVAVGTKRARRCDPNYTGACVPIASDVDCAGGSGDGPGYVAGPVRVVGSDIYDLDRDGDGIACDT
ncbi:G5 domain-containing protein [Actinomadura sp. WMMA1423]|uniref:G5 domain-containing protein n=1 Tax=Actinomadura sp. WMMA1423 TaxID=2591108 RepID=UPI00197AB35C|nr:G5 domain-containing protein [Actinomadura sp. WMMA1423]